MVKQSWYHP